MITALAYRASTITESLGHLRHYQESDFQFFAHPLSEKERLRERVKAIVLRDIRSRRENARAPFHMVVFLVDGALPQGDIKIALDSLLLQIIDECTRQLDEEERQANLLRLQAERARKQQEAETQRTRDFQTLKTLLDKYSADELKAAGVLHPE